MIKAAVELGQRGEAVGGLHVDFLKMKGKVYQERCSYKKALDCYKRAYDLSHHLTENTELQEELLNKIGNMQTRIGYYRMAQLSFEKALDISQDNLRRGINRLNLGTVNSFLGKFGDAVFCLEQAIHYFKLTDSRKYYPHIYSSLGILYLKTGDYGKSLIVSESH